MSWSEGILYGISISKERNPEKDVLAFQNFTMRRDEG